MFPYIDPVFVFLGPYESMVDATQTVKIIDMLRLAEVKHLYVPRLNHVVWWYQTPTIAEADHLVHPPDMDRCSLIETSVAFAGVGIQFECVIQPFFKDTLFGERSCEWQE